MPDAPAPPPMQIEREIRFAVVMYGGVSLAIYINGVAQELLHLVRSTAADPDDGTRVRHRDASGTEAVYREIGQLLGADEGDLPADAPIRARFVVDVLSGTSAGGINGIFLAKALANGQAMDDLQRLWVEKGDVAELLNDARLEPSLREDPPESLLSGRYMYDQLLRAFDGMDRNGAASSPYVDELDLFVTTTDIRGLPLPLQLWDGVADEKRHRNVFTLRYRADGVEGPCNDFLADNNAFLAFAARCTSAFPFAFEPMRARDAMEATPTAAHEWGDYFPAYRPAASDGTGTPDPFSWQERAFGDGGYLDNKPFSYAIDVLASRRASCPVERRLVYVEPDPERLDWSKLEQERRSRPNAVENVNAALSLARYETIREDLERVLNRNALVGRVEHLLAGLEDDVARIRDRSQPFGTAEFQTAGLRARVEEFGPSYGAYHRLKISALVDELAQTICRAVRFDEAGGHFRAIRAILRAWLDLRYDENGEGNRKPQNEFLFTFDVAYRVRRLLYVLGKIDALGTLDERAKGLLARWNAPVPEEAERGAFRAELQRLRTGLARALALLQTARRRTSADPRVLEAIARTQLQASDLHPILDAPADRRGAHARDLAQARVEAFDRLRAAVAAQLSEATIKAAREAEALLDGAEPRPDEPPAATLARTIVRGYYAWFEYYDLLSYPVLFATNVGDELSTVEVARISPQDATTLRRPNERKLAGTQFGHFGAFLDRGWRENDILWGRLDGAERLITMLLRGTRHDDRRRELIEKAHTAILHQWFDRATRDGLCQLIADVVAKAARDGSERTTILEVVRARVGEPLNERLETALRACLEPEQVYAFFKDSYRVRLDLDRHATTALLGRATRITGKILEQVSDRARVSNRPAAWVARLGSALSAMLEVAVPTTTVGDVGRRLLALLVLGEILLAGGGWLLANEAVERFGIMALAITAAGWLASHALGDFVARRQRWRTVAIGGAMVAGAVTVLLVSVGGLHLSHDLTRLGRWVAERLSPTGEAVPTPWPRHLLRMLPTWVPWTALLIAAAAFGWVCGRISERVLVMPSTTWRPRSQR